jgi:hypothetical protein
MKVQWRAYDEFTRRPRWPGERGEVFVSSPVYTTWTRRKLIGVTRTD